MKAFSILCRIATLALVTLGAYHGWSGNYQQGTFELVSALVLIASETK